MAELKESREALLESRRHLASTNLGNKYERERVYDYFKEKFPNTFREVHPSGLVIVFANGRYVKVDELADYDSGEVLARCIMVHSLPPAP